MMKINKYCIFIVLKLLDGKNICGMLFTSIKWCIEHIQFRIDVTNASGMMCHVRSHILFLTVTLLDCRYANLILG